jgi:hypothetical protein
MGQRVEIGAAAACTRHMQRRKAVVECSATRTWCRITRGGEGGARSILK